ncbi:hypothetical protein G7046_g4292 [Stylonectria norvegica]|nr:hypothetical protein G7046_g4292 [Stylonectria norvegica]
MCLEYVDMRFFFRNIQGAPPRMGFMFSIPRGANNENDGFGQAHHMHPATRLLEPSPTLTIAVNLPRGQFDYTLQPVDENLRQKVPKARTAMRVTFKADAQVFVEGFGMPFENRDNPVYEEWLNRNGSVVGEYTLLNILQQKEFFIAVNDEQKALDKRMRASESVPSFAYPWADRHDWFPSRYQKLTEQYKSSISFAAAFQFENENDHMSALAHGVAQDSLWLAQEAAKIFATKFLAYFVPTEHDGQVSSRCYYAILSPPKLFLESFKDTWKKIVSDECFKLAFHNDMAAMEQLPDLEHEDTWHELARAVWEAKVMDCPETIDALAQHPVESHEVVLLVKRPSPEKEPIEVPEFSARNLANAALSADEPQWAPVSVLFSGTLNDTGRKVNAVCQYRAAAKPTNPFVVHGVDPASIEQTITTWPIPPKAQLDMAIHRDLVRGCGFYSTLVGDIRRVNDKRVDNLLPVVNYLRDVPSDYIDALLRNILPGDRARFQRYISETPAGLAIIAAGPGFGKTTAIAVATLAMIAGLGQIYGSAPTHAAVDNFAYRLFQIDEDIVKSVNKNAADGPVARCKIIVRGYKPLDELAAFRKLLRDPQAGDSAASSASWRRDSKWKLKGSMAYWMLMLLGSKAVRELGQDDSASLHALHAEFHADKSLDTLRSVAQGKEPWNAFSDCNQNKTTFLQHLFEKLLAIADIVCTTSALSEQKPYQDFKNKRAKGIAVDESGSITRADLYSVWGNTLLPCLLVGDEKQLKPVVMTTLDVDNNKNLRNLHAPDAGVSPLLFFKANGWPIYRMRTQFRMAYGMFDLCQQVIYSDLPAEYGPGCDISLPIHQIGHDLEKFLRARYPTLAAPPPDKFRPAFISCKGCRAIRTASGSKTCFGQVKIALDFLADFVSVAKVDPSRITVIAPYKGNVELAKVLRKRRHEYLPLASMDEVATLGSFQGREGDIVVVVMGTTFIGDDNVKGPGFTKQPERLNVMLSRQRSGLVVFGDINVSKHAKARRDGKKRPFVSKTVLDQVYEWFVGEGRVAEA